MTGSHVCIWPRLCHHCLILCILAFPRNCFGPPGIIKNGRYERHIAYLVLRYNKHLVPRKKSTGAFLMSACPNLSWYWPCNGLFARHVKSRFAHAPVMSGTFSPPPWVSDPHTHHGTCVTHVSWWMPWSLTNVFLWSWWRGKRFPCIPGACATHNFTYLARGPCR